MSLENTFKYHHDNPPAAFNHPCRQVIAAAVSAVHAIWCEENPDANRTERDAAHKAISDALRNIFPSVGEKAAAELAEMKAELEAETSHKKTPPAGIAGQQPNRQSLRTS